MWRGLIVVGLVLLPSCGQTALAPKVGMASPESGTPKRYVIPATFREYDLICEEPNQIATCVTVAELRAFLLSRKAEP